MPQDPPVHPSQIGEWKEAAPWCKVLDPSEQAGSSDGYHSLCDNSSAMIPPGSCVAHVSQLLMQQNAILCGDAASVLRTLPDDYFACCITSPPYWESRHSGKLNRLGAEIDPYDYIRRLLEVFREVRRTLTSSGTLWLVIGDSYAIDNPEWWEKYIQLDRKDTDNHRVFPDGFKAGDTMGIPWRLAVELQNDGWYLRSDIIWSIPNYPQERSRDRPERVHNYVFLLAKSDRYTYNVETTSRRTVWDIPTILNSPIAYTVFPEALVERCMTAGSFKDDIVLDPFFGSGTVGIVAKRLKRRYVGIEIDPKTAALAGKRISEGA